MKIVTGLFDHMVLQRSHRNVSEAAVTGTTEADGVLRAEVTQGGRPVRGLSDLRMGASKRGRFSVKLAGIPVGGPYDIHIEVVDRGGEVLDQLAVKDVLVGDVWLLGGQSNMQGCGLLDGTPGPHPMVRAFYMNDAWRMAKDPIHNMWEAIDKVHAMLCGGNLPPKPAPNWGVGPGVAFGQEMLKYTGMPQGLLACGHGGTSMAQWDPALKSKGTESLYGAMVRRLIKNGGRVAGLVWYQGCSDANTETVQHYTKRMQDFVRAVRRDTGVANLPVATVQISRVINWSGDCWNLIQDQQRRLPDVIRNLVTVPAIDCQLDDVIHLSGRGQVVTGRRLAQAMAVLKYGRKFGPLPIAVRKMSMEPVKPGTTCNILVEFDNVAGKLVAGSRPVGFSVLGSDGQECLFDVVLRGNKAVLRTLQTEEMLGGATVWYGRGSNPACNIVDEAGRSLPVFGPIPTSRPRAYSGFVTQLRVSRFLQGAGKLGGLKYPKSKVSLKLVGRSFTGNFCNMHPEIEKLAPEDVVLYFACDIDCREPMKLLALLGYDGPVKVWLDGRQILHDPNGINPAVPGQKKIPIKAGKGRHEILIALGTNQGRAWGVFLAFQRMGVPYRLLKKGPGSYSMPVVLG